MYTAQQIRDKIYIPQIFLADQLLDIDDVMQLIILADAGSKFSIKIRKDVLFNDVVPTMKNFGYNVQELEFLGTKFIQISW